MREPSVTRLNLRLLSCVNCTVFNTPGGGGGELSQANAAARTTSTENTAAAHAQRDLPARAGTTAAWIFPEVVSRLSRFKSAHISVALWNRTSRSFSKALLMIRSNSAGTSGFRRVAAVGVPSRTALKITPDVSPRNGSVPVD